DCAAYWKWRLVENEPMQSWQLPCGLQAAQRAVRMSEQRDALTGAADHGRNVLRFTLDGVRRRIAAMPPAAPVHRMEREIRLEKRSDSRPARMVGRRAVHRNERRPGAGTPHAHTGA